MRSRTHFLAGLLFLVSLVPVDFVASLALSDTSRIEAQEQLTVPPTNTLHASTPENLTNESSPTPTPTPDVLPDQGIGDAWTSVMLNMRTGPGTDYDRVIMLYEETFLVLEGRTEDLSWVLGRTRSCSFRGWVASSYLFYRLGFSLEDLPISDEIPAAPCPSVQPDSQAETVPPSPATPRPPEVLPSDGMLVADFENEMEINNLGGMIGVNYQPSSCNTLTEDYSDGVARLAYQICDQATFWMSLQGVDLRSYSQLAFRIRAEAPAFDSVRIELRHSGWLAHPRSWIYTYVSGVTSDWQTVVVDLASFVPVEHVDGQQTVSVNMDELAFTFEVDRSGTNGVVYLDNVIFFP